MKNYVLKTIEETIQEHELINKGDHIVLGLSGGPDSLCLFSVFMELREQAGFTMEAVHVNHQLRPGEADEDQAFVEEFCREHGVTCTVFTKDCRAIAEKRGLTEEEAGRMIRYEAFDTVAERHGNPVRIAVAQNMDDQCETMLLRLMRGTGPDGLSAIQYCRTSEKGFSIIRPLLDVDRKHIEEYCREKNLHPRKDRTNCENRYTRNRVRNELLPFIEEKFNPEFKKALIRLSRSLAADREYFEKETAEAFRKISDEEGRIALSEYAQYPESIRKRMLMRMMEKAGLASDVFMVHVEAVDALALKNETGKRIQLPKGYVAEIQYGRLKIYGEARDTAKRKVTASFSRKALMEAFGTCEYEVRRRANGDYMYLNVGRKKVKDILMDEKIPREKRDELLVVAIGSEVLWIPGVRYGSRYRTDLSQEDVLTVEIFVNI